ncbi:MAG: SDR family NAD(P)-dependent oxidoreductase, partial [Betaproteobacteria bacterium]
MTPPPKGRRALVTGSFQGIGLAIAEALAAESCHIVLHGLATPAQQEAARTAVLSAGALSVTCHSHDLCEGGEVDKLME